MSNPIQRQPVLVVDDDEDLRRTLVLILRRAGYVVTAVRSGDECLEKMREGFRGVILMDIMMPGKDGWATVQGIVDGGWLPGSLVCMLTACVEPEPTVEGLREYIFDYLVKPFEVESLIAVVEFASAQLVS